MKYKIVEKVYKVDTSEDPDNIIILFHDEECEDLASLCEILEQKYHTSDGFVVYQELYEVKEGKVVWSGEYKKILTSREVLDNTM